MKQISPSPRTLPDSTPILRVSRRCVLRGFLQLEAYSLPEAGSMGHSVVLWLGGFSSGLMCFVPCEGWGVLSVLFFKVKLQNNKE